MRCFVRNNVLLGTFKEVKSAIKLTKLGVSQRDSNCYEHLCMEDTQIKMTNTIRAFWEDELRGVYDGGPDCEFALFATN